MKTVLGFSFIILFAVLLSGCTWNSLSHGEPGAGTPVTGIPRTPLTPVPDITTEIASPTSIPDPSVSLETPLQEAVEGKIRLVPGGSLFQGQQSSVPATRSLSK
jgi:hypothetical protein